MFRKYGSIQHAQPSGDWGEAVAAKLQSAINFICEALKMHGEIRRGRTAKSFKSMNIQLVAARLFHNLHRMSRPYYRRGLGSKLLSSKI